MNKRTRSLLSPVPLLTLLAIHPLTLAWDKALYARSLRDHVGVMGTTLLSVNTRTLAACSSLCRQYRGCGGMRYDGRGLCTLVAENSTLTDWDAAIVKQGHSCGRDKCLTPWDICVPVQEAMDNICLKYIETLTVGKQCLTNNHCIDPHAECYNNECRCMLGYLYSDTTSGCIIECLTPSSVFVAYPKAGIRGYNNLKIFATTIDGCVTTCLTTSFTCKSIEFYHVEKSCLLSQVTWADLQEADKAYNDVNWTLYLRQCS